jgi:hypothetical protein
MGAPEGAPGFLVQFRGLSRRTRDAIGSNFSYRLKVVIHLDVALHKHRGSAQRVLREGQAIDVRAGGVVDLGGGTNGPVTVQPHFIIVIAHDVERRIGVGHVDHVGRAQRILAALAIVAEIIRGTISQIDRLDVVDAIDDIEAVATRVIIEIEVEGILQAKHVEASAAVDRAVGGVIDQPIVAGLTVEAVVATAAGQNVVSGTSIQSLARGSSNDDLVVAVTGEIATGIFLHIDRRLIWSATIARLVGEVVATIRIDGEARTRIVQGARWAIQVGSVHFRNRQRSVGIRIVAQEPGGLNCRIAAVADNQDVVDGIRRINH